MPFPANKNFWRSRAHTSRRVGEAIQNDSITIVQHASSVFVRGRDAQSWFFVRDARGAVRDFGSIRSAEQFIRQHMPSAKVVSFDDLFVMPLDQYIDDLNVIDQGAWNELERQWE